MATTRKTKLGVALIQFDTKSNLNDTLKHLTEMVDKACTQYKPRVICLPEGFNYFYQSNKEVFEKSAEAVDGPTAQHMSALAKKYNIYLIGGITTREDGKLFNTALVFNPNGEQIAKHHKVNLCEIDFPNGTKLDERSCFVPGDDVTTFKIDDVRCGVCICNDAVFDEWVKIYRKLGTELLFVPAADDIIEGRGYSLHNYWYIVHQARAFDNQMYVAALSGARNENTKDFVLYGHTMMVDPQGKIMKEAGTKEEIVYTEIDASFCEKLYKQFPTYRYRRKDIHDKYNHIYYPEPKF